MVNAHVAVREWKDDIVFLRKIVPGRSDRSYGIQVARLAGLPPAVIARAREILHRARARRTGARRPAGASAAQRPAPQQQLGLFQAASPADERLRERLREVDVNRTTPLEALQLLAALKADAEG